MKHYFFLIALFFALNNGAAQPIQTVKPYYVGHSLVNLHIPAMVQSLAIHAGKSTDYAYQIGIGANLLYQWDTTLGFEQGTLWQFALPSGQFDALIFTEAVPLLGHLMWSKTYAFSDSFHRAAVQGNPAMRTFIYETWHCKSTGTPAGCEYDNDDALLWRPRLTADFPLWAGIMDTLKTRHPSAPIWMVPAGQAFGNLVDSIEAGSVPGISDFKQFFTDEIHVNDLGNYFVACVMYACLFRDSPVGLTNQTLDEDGLPILLFPSPGLALKMQQTAWQTVQNLGNRTGVQPISEAGEIATSDDAVRIFPNPFSGNTVRVFSEKTPISMVELIDYYGNTILQKSDLTQHELDFELPRKPLNSLVFLKIRLLDGRFLVKKLVW